MKKIKTENIKKIHTDGKHTFLSWLIVPVVMLWLSAGYLIGLVNDKPIWRNEGKNHPTNQISAYFQDHGTFSEDLDQPFVTFWFDDAWLSQYLVAYPILAKNGFPGTIAVPTNAIEAPNYMNWAQLRVMQRTGWEITDHSLVHDCEMQKWDRVKIENELRTSKYILWKNGLASDIFVSPCGVDSKTMRDEVKKTFIGYRTVDPGFNNPSDFDLYNLKVKNVDNKTTVEQMKRWIDEAKETKSWAILVFHKLGETTGIVTEDEFNTPKKNLEAIATYVKESNIKVVVPSQIMASQNYEQ